MLSVAALSAQDLQMPALALFSPSKHPFMKRVQKSRFSFDPYKLVLASQKVALPILKVNTPVANVAETIVTAPTVATATETAVKKSSITSSTIRYACVAFKQGAALLRAPFRVAVGDLVVVEGDRGEHIGTVKSITTEPADTVTAKIIRRASAADRQAFDVKLEKEHAATIEITKIASDVRLNATVVDVEYQFDMNKLTIFVERATATTFVDFRKLQRTLFRQFHCRIWCAYMDEIKA